MIQWVYEGAKQAIRLDEVVVATDDKRIFRVARGFGANVVMTSSLHTSGTERVAEAAASLEAAIILNIQGDEPLITGTMLDHLISAFEDSSVVMASLMAKVDDLSLIDEDHIVKVVTDEESNALYFSRSPLPCGALDYFFQHIGVYGYTRDALFRFQRLSPSRLEKSERLEQLRALEHGWKIKMVEIPIFTLSVDVPADIIKVETFLKKRAHE
jgi:3-deoxy-manno-octulosonate cytidylyltransferase (CMP-KDO synthetase)